MWPDARQDDFVAVMNLKGMKKADQQVMLDAIGPGAFAQTPGLIGAPFNFHAR